MFKKEMFSSHTHAHTHTLSLSLCQTNCFLHRAIKAETLTLTDKQPALPTNLSEICGTSFSQTQIANPMPNKIKVKVLLGWFNVPFRSTPEWKVKPTRVNRSFNVCHKDIPPILRTVQTVFRTDGLHCWVWMAL